MTATPTLEAAVAAAAQDCTDIRNMTLTEFVIVASLVGWDDAGDQVSAVAIMNSDAPNHRLLGLVESARIRFRSYESDPEDE